MKPNDFPNLPARSGVTGLPPVASIPATEWENADAPHPLLEMGRTLLQRKWIIAAVALGSAVLAALVASTLTPIYRSSAGVLIEAERAKLVSIQEVYGGVPGGGRENFQTQAELLRSRDVASRVIDELKLDALDEFAPRQSRLDRLLVTIGIGNDRFDDPAARQADVVHRFGERLSTEPVLLSNVIRVSFESRDPALAAKVANTVVEAFVQADMDNRYRMTQSAARWINQRMNELKAKLETSENALQAYRESQGLLDSRNTVLGGNNKQLEELMQRLVEARVRRSNAEQAFNQAKAGEGRAYESSPAVVGNPVVQKAREAESAAERRLAEMGASYGTAHPVYANARSELEAARANVARQAQLVVASLQKEFNAARATEQSLEEALQRSRGTIQQLNRKDIQAGQLEREVETNRQVYQTFLARYKETTATSDLRLPNARLIDVAVPSLYPVKPNRPMIVAAAAVIGALIAALVVIALRRINNTVLRRADVEDRLRQPVLAALPRLLGERSKQRSREVMLQPDSVYSETIRTANTGVMLSMLDSRRKIVAISSSVPGEGKSTFAVNFCLSLAQSTSVVLVEADLRRPTLARAAGLSEPPRPAGTKIRRDGKDGRDGKEEKHHKDEKHQTVRKEPTLEKSPEDPKGPASSSSAAASGLSHLLAGSCTLEEALHTVPGSDLQCIVAGRRPQNPLMVLGSRRFEQLLDSLAERFEVVVIDCPPVQAVSDPLVVARHATGLVFMVQGASTPLPLAAEALKRFTSIGVPVLGVVVNAHDFEAAERYHGEYSGHGKYGYN